MGIRMGLRVYFAGIAAGIYEIAGNGYTVLPPKKGLFEIPETQLTDKNGDQKSNACFNEKYNPQIIVDSQPAGNC
jgi:hypothetical protein